LSLDELEGSWGEPEAGATDLIIRCHALHCKRLLVLTDVEVELALRQRIGLTWIRVLALQRLRVDPLREGCVGTPGDLLRNALSLGRAVWGELASDLEQIVAPLISTLSP